MVVRTPGRIRRPRISSNGLKTKALLNHGYDPSILCGNDGYCEVYRTRSVLLNGGESRGGGTQKGILAESVDSMQANRIRKFKQDIG